MPFDWAGRPQQSCPFGTSTWQPVRSSSSTVCCPMSGSYQFAPQPWK